MTLFHPASVADTWTWAWLLAAAFAAGFVDAVAGGGGLITTPALLIAFPQAPIAGILATTKCSSLAGTAGAMATYARRVPIPWRLVAPGMAAAGIAAWAGARTVSHADPSLLKPAILAVLIALAAYTAWRPRLGAVERLKGPRPFDIPLAIAIGLALGFYDGFLGPGTGALLVVAFIAAFGKDFLGASACAKFLNGCSNLGALLYFARAHAILFPLALPMAACNLLGGLAGSRMAVAAGNVWIRRVFLAVALALIVRLGWSLRAGL
jgi:uncharacterized membrane protein YfcA